MKKQSMKKQSMKKQSMIKGIAIFGIILLAAGEVIDLKVAPESRRKDIIKSMQPLSIVFDNEKHK